MKRDLLSQLSERMFEIPLKGSALVLSVASAGFLGKAAETLAKYTNCEAFRKKFDAERCIQLRSSCSRKTPAELRFGPNQLCGRAPSYASAKTITQYAHVPPSAQRNEVVAPDSIDRSDSGGALARAHPDTTPVPHQATTVGLQRSGIGDAQQRGILHCAWPTQTFQEGRSHPRTQ